MADLTPEEARLTAARALLQAAEDRLQAGDPKAALASARGGLERLGPDYAPAGVKDDTTMYLHLADEHERAGRLDRAARTAIDMLRTRVRLFTRSRADRSDADA